MYLVSSIPSLDGWDALLRLAIACGLGAAIGFEREIRDREAGIRTHLLVSLGSALFTIVSAYGFHAFLASGDNIVRTDPTRIAAQIVTGIGFLGAGAIIREGLSIRGLTTAATLWVVAAIGMACGAGYYWPAAAATLLTIFALWPLRILAYRLIEQIRPEENRLTVELKEGEPLTRLLALIHNVRQIEVTDETDRRIVQLETPDADEELVARLSDADFVIGVKWRR
ncbi:MAG TPA: MgtC/SapB family protein [Gaiellaceae bacterium]|jgi:putative Mg2+ transporter-C (MgtC) family protein